MIQVSNLTKKYGARVAVDDISFNIGKNEIVGFLGPNGAGKSTTLKVLTCFHGATKGTVLIDGKNVLTRPEEVLAIIGYLPENVPLYPEMRVREYLEYRSGLKGVTKKNRKNAVNRVIELCRINDVQNRIIGQLSKGYRQRTGLADALIADPKVLILDEPTVGLDPSQIKDMRELIKEMGKDRTVILSSHILPEVEAVCSRVLIINRGKIAGDGKPGELKHKFLPKQHILEIEVIDRTGVCSEKLFNQIDGITDVEQHDNFRFVLTFTDEINNNNEKGKKISSTDIRESIFDAAVSSGFKIISMTKRTGSLEDLFLDIVTTENHDGKNHEISNVNSDINTDTGSDTGSDTDSANEPAKGDRS